jgi:antitoxin CptB
MLPFKQATVIGNANVRRRIRLRAWRRGMRETDLILGSFADSHVEAMGRAELAVFEALLEENDQNILRWLTGQESAPAELAALVLRIRQDSARSGG